MEIIAKKYPRMRAFIVILVASVMLIVIGAVLLALSGIIVNYPDALDYIGFALIIIGVACTAMMVISIVRYCRLPDNLITYENGIISFPKGVSCRADEVTDIDCKLANPSYKGMTYDFGFGLITVGIGDKKIKVYYVSSPEAACEKLRSVVNEARLLK